MISPNDRYLIYHNNPYEKDCDNDKECIMGMFETYDDLIQVLDLTPEDIERMMNKFNRPSIYLAASYYVDHVFYNDIIDFWEVDLIEIRGSGILYLKYIAVPAISSSLA